MIAMIFAAGMGTRLRPLTDRMPKALVPIAGKPLLQWQIEKLREAGLTRIVINIHHKAEQIVQFVEQHNGFGCNISFSDERDELLETGGGLMKAMQDFSNLSMEPWLALNADILSTLCLDRFIGSYQGELARLVVSPRATKRYLVFDNDMTLRGWTNRETGALRPADLDLTGTQLLAFSGMQIVSPQVMTYMLQMPERRFSLIDLYLHIIARKGMVTGYVPNDYQMMDVGKIDQLTEAEQWAEQWIATPKQE